MCPEHFGFRLVDRIFTILILGLLILLTSWCRSTHACPTGQEPCEKFQLYSIDDPNMRKFNAIARCCFLPRRSAFEYSPGQYPPAARKEEIHWKILYEAQYGYKPVLSLTFNYSLCRPQATLIKGFDVNLMRISSGGTSYRSKRINITNAVYGTDSRDKLSIEVRFKDDLLRNNSEYNLSIESLPGDDPSPNNVAQVPNIRTRASVTKRDVRETGSQLQIANERNELGEAQNRQRRSADGISLIEEIRRWVPKHDYTYSEGVNGTYVVNFWFIQAPCEYGFQSYRISMNNCTNASYSDCHNRKSFFQKYYGEGEHCDRRYFGRCIMEGYHETYITIEDVAPGYYKIYLWPRKGDTTQLEKLVRIVPEPPGKPSPDPTYITTAEPITGERKSGVDNPPPVAMAAIVIGSLIGVALLVVIALVGWYKRRKKVNAFRMLRHTGPPTPDPENNNPRDPNNIRKRVVTIFNSPDHKQHELCVDILASFLSNHCNCEVNWAGSSLEKLRSDVAGWVIKSFEEAHVIILIHSKGAYEKDQLLQRQEEFMLERDPPSLTENLFIQALSLLNTVLFDKSKNIINVHFSYTDESNVIERFAKNRVRPLILTRDISELFCLIHELNPNYAGAASIKQNVYLKPDCGPALDEAINHFAEIQKENPHWFWKTHQKKRRPFGGNRGKPRHDSGDANNDGQCDSGFSEQGPHGYSNENEIDSLVAQSSLFPFGMDDRYDFCVPVDLHGDVKPKNNNTSYNNIRQQQERLNKQPLNNAASLVSPPHPTSMRSNDASTSVFNASESPTLPLSRRAMGQQAPSAPPQGGPQPSVLSLISHHPTSVHSYHPSLATSNATYSSSQPPSLPRSGNSSTRSSRSRNPSGGSRASSNHSNAPMPRNNAAPPFGDLVSFQGDSAHPSSFREEEEFLDDMNFAAPAESDVSSINTEMQERELQLVNDEFDYHNDNDSGCDDPPPYVRFPSSDRFDQMSV